MMEAEPLFNAALEPNDFRPGVRTTDLEPARWAAVTALPTVQKNRLLVLQLLSMSEHPLTMFDPYVLMGCDPRFKQTAIGPRFKGLREQGLIQLEPSRRPLPGAESNNLVSAFSITSEGIAYLRDNMPEGVA